MTRSRHVAAVALGLALMIAGTSTAMATTRAPASAATFDAAAQLRAWGMDLLGQALALVQPQGNVIYRGSDNRLTVLLLGSDQRPGLKGERLDVIIVATYKSSPERVSFASIPRDTIRFPRASSNGGGTSGSTRVNQLFKDYRSGSCNKDCALRKFRADVEKALDVEIDHYVYLKFNGFEALVDRVSGIPVSSQGLVDKSFRDEPSNPPGVWFASGGVTLKGFSAPTCYSWKRSDPSCKSALVYVRSRKGTEGGSSNNDYRRSSRQQSFVYDGIERVLARGSGSNLSNLRSLINQMDNETNSALLASTIPTTASAAAELYSMLNGASLGPRVVFKPPYYATANGATIRLKYDRVRAWVNANLTTAGP